MHSNAFGFTFYMRGVIDSRVFVPSLSPFFPSVPLWRVCGGGGVGFKKAHWRNHVARKRSALEVQSGEAASSMGGETPTRKPPLKSSNEKVPLFTSVCQ